MVADSFICIVDDDDSMRKALSRLARQLGNEVRGFASAEQFVSSGCAEQCDCVVTDLQMREMSGLDLMAWLASNYPSIDVLMVTGFATPDVEAAALERGAIGVFRKPLDFDLFTAALKRATAQD